MRIMLALCLAGLVCASACAAVITVSERHPVAAAAGKHYGYPRLVRAANGDLLLFFRIGDTRTMDRGEIAMITSRDGKTWSKPRTIEGAAEPDHGWTNPVAAVLPAGRIVLWLSSLQMSPPNRRHPNYWRSSDDNGATWTTPARFDTANDRSTWFVTDAINMYDGLLASAVTYPGGGTGNTSTVIWHSPDGGRSWNIRSTLTKPIDNRGDDAALLETASGEILCALAMRSGRGLAQFRSSDAGRSWTEGQNFYGMLRCTLQRPVLTRLSKIRVLLTGRDVDRKEVVAYLSDDNGRSFGGRTVIDSYTVDAAGSTCVPAGPSSAVAAYYTDSGAGMAKAEIRTVRISVK